MDPPATLSITPEVIDTRVTWAVDMNASVLDHVGHVLEDAEIVWEVLRPGDEIDQTGHYVPNQNDFGRECVVSSRDRHGRWLDA